MYYIKYHEGGVNLKMKYFKSMLLLIYIFAISCEDSNQDQNAKDNSNIEDDQPAIPCLKANIDCERTIELRDTQNFTFDLYSTHPLDSTMQVKNAIIFVHGRERNSNEYFKTMVSAIESLEQTENVAVISPKFKNEEDVYNDTDIYWSYLGWRYGNNSQPSSNEVRHSSFAIIDTLVQKLSSKTHFPQMKKIIIAGHSAGAQFSQLYSTGNKMDGNIGDISMNYWIANSQFFLYANEFRWSKSDSDFYIPSTSECSNYDEYPRGMIDRNNYMNSLSEVQIINNLSRNVTLLLGELDITSSLLTTTCYATLLGDNRFDRGSKYYQFLNKYYPNHNYRKVTIPGADHDRNKIYLSPEGLSFINSEIIK